MGRFAGRLSGPDTRRESLEPRLKSELWVKALIRRCFAAEVAAYLRHRGEAGAGAVLIIAAKDGRAVVYGRGLMTDGRWGWRRASGPSAIAAAEAEAYIERQRKFDPDLWVVEIEAPALEPFVDDPVEDYPNT